MFVPKHLSVTAVCLVLVTASIPASAQDNPAALDLMLTQSHEVAQAAQDGGALGEAMQIAQGSPGEPAATLPNGASSITETFNDWTVNCAAQGGRKMCAMSQAQGNSQTGEQLFAIELYGSPDGRSEGILVLPFGLDVRAPVALAVGDEPLGSGAAFTTCMPGGCIVPVAFSQSELEALKGGTTATVTAKSASAGGEPAEFVISLSGFTAATNRVDQLAQ